MKTKLLFLGTGTSTGIPVIGCHCKACTSLDPCDKRLRTSALCSVDDTNLLIDCGPDFRQQMLRAHSPRIDAILITHNHIDHVGGVDDVRPYCAHGHYIPIYCTESVAAALRKMYYYCFAENRYPGVPRIELKVFDEQEPITINGIEVVPLPVMHGKLPIVGYRLGKVAYITDSSTIPGSTIDKIRGIDTLVINALRHEEHPSHLSLGEALEIIKDIHPRQAYLTHMSHDMGPEADVVLPHPVRFAHDFLTLDIPS